MRTSLHDLHRRCHIDISAGVTLVQGRPVRQTVVVNKLLTNYVAPAVPQTRADPSEIVLPLACQRMDNYCRWWLDSVAKLFVCNRSSLLRSNLRGSSLRVVLPKLNHRFQRESMMLLDNTHRVCVDSNEQLIHGRTVNSSGLTFGGGQNIGSLLKEFSHFLEFAVPPDQAKSSGERLFISRNNSPMRRILNEDAILPKLRDLGFDIIKLEALPLHAQIQAFRNARIILAAHGAGLTNLIFCRPGTTLIEIFPEGGVHGSAFSRIASHLDFNYFFVAGNKVANKRSEKNPNNADIMLDVPSFFSFLGQALG